MNAASASSTAFVPTRWTLVLRARGESSEARTALSELCEAYYQPVRGFIRARCSDDDAAKDLTQEFFARLLGGGGIGAADPRRGRFRSYLLGAVKHFLSDHRDHERRAKRGGGAIPDSLEVQDDHASLLDKGAGASAPEYHAFDSAWALALMDRALRTLEGQFTTEARENQFAVLKPWLTGDSEALRQSAAAEQLGMSESAVKVAIHRLRKSFREIIRSEIAQTVADPSEVEEELRHLVAVLAKR